MERVLGPTGVMLAWSETKLMETDRSFHSSFDLFRFQEEMFSFYRTRDRIFRNSDKCERKITSLLINGKAVTHSKFLNGAQPKLFPNAAVGFIF